MPGAGGTERGSGSKGAEQGDGPWGGGPVVWDLIDLCKNVGFYVNKTRVPQESGNM